MRPLLSFLTTLSLAAPLSALAEPGSVATASSARLAALEARIAMLEAELAQRPKDLGAYTLPTGISLCGQPVPLDRPEVKERVEREFYLMLGDRDQVVLWTKRARRVFPVVDAAVQKTSACGDIKYLAVIESGLRPAVTSHADAHGWWQFMSPTAREYGLAVEDAWDERADLDASTQAGARYLRDLARGFGGDWALGMAAYNTGMGRLNRAIDAQGTRDFWSLDLVEEAERYVPRVIAAKAIMQNLQSYGFVLPVEQGYPEDPVDIVDVRIDGARVSVLDAARAMGVEARTLRRLNPTLADTHLPTGRSFGLRVPRGQGARVTAWAQGGGRGTRAVEAAPAETPRSKAAQRETRATDKARAHTVARGESLGAIASKHGVSVDALRKLNRLGGRDHLQVGQRLIVRR
jgi:hypothetical protein